MTIRVPAGWPTPGVTAVPVPDLDPPNGWGVVGDIDGTVVDDIEDGDDG